ncbi:hypothetical protein MUP77_09345 [Candidatus Bathyarchaeota archaeon]|nr:hypothetical protein [Candidatus Bathyarchaeota archaeon]
MSSPRPSVLRNKRTIIHHGDSRGEFEPKYVGTDYFGFHHKQCRANARIDHVLIDNQGRIIFNLTCVSCGQRDALKTSPYLFRVSEKPKGEFPYTQIFKLSPNLGQCVKHHRWDDF